VSHVLPKLFERSPAPRLARLLGGNRHVAERSARRVASVIRGHSLREVPFHFPLNVISDFFVELVVASATSHERAEARANSRYHRLDSRIIPMSSSVFCSATLPLDSQ
jgi:hypothetical protein